MPINDSNKVRQIASIAARNRRRGPGNTGNNTDDNGVPSTGRPYSNVDRNGQRTNRGPKGTGPTTRWDLPFGLGAIGWGETGKEQPNGSWARVGHIQPYNLVGGTATANPDTVREYLKRKASRKPIEADGGIGPKRLPGSTPQRQMDRKQNRRPNSEKA